LIDNGAALKENLTIVSTSMKVVGKIDKIGEFLGPSRLINVALSRLPRDKPPRIDVLCFANRADRSHVLDIPVGF